MALERDKATVDLMDLIHDIVGANQRLRAGIEVTKRRATDKDTQDRMDRMNNDVDSIDAAIDAYYLKIKGVERKK